MRFADEPENGPPAGSPHGLRMGHGMGHWPKMVAVTNFPTT